MLKQLFSGIIATSLICSTASACNTVGLAHLGSAKIDEINVYYDNGRSELTITEDEFLDHVIDYFMSLSGTWTRLTEKASATTGSITFLSEEQNRETISITSQALLRSGCAYDLSSDEKAEFIVMFHLGREAFDF